MNAKRVISATAAAAALLVSVCSAADGAAPSGLATAPYNEAVRLGPDGKRIVEMPPVREELRNRTSWVKPSQIPGIRIGVETPEGLMDCRGVRGFVPSACEPSNFGRVIWGRQWVVKRSGIWQVCVGRAKPIKCVGINEPPYLPAVEE